jgi:NAD(P)-dependent dehydrogenase (short-subunit alcohol dehydrogenase family)
MREISTDGEQMSERGQFLGQVVWITGGGTGIGEAMAYEFARRGAKIAVSGRRLEPLEAVVASCQALGADAIAVPCDVTDEHSVRGAVAAIIARWDRLDVAVANAGFAISGRVEELPLEDWRRQFDTNVFGLVATVQAALPELKRSRGRVALISSVAGVVSSPGTGAYNASKYAVRAIGQTLAMELEGSGVSCSIIQPGFVESEIARVDRLGVHHADWEDRRPQLLMWTAERAASVVVDAIWRREREFTFTGHGKLGAFLGMHSPGLVHRAVTTGLKLQRVASVLSKRR